jgi:hypothetical protein
MSKSSTQKTKRMVGCAVYRYYTCTSAHRHFRKIGTFPVSLVLIPIEVAQQSMPQGVLILAAFSVSLFY